MPGKRGAVKRTPVIGADLGTPAEGDQAAARWHCTPGPVGEQLKARLLRILHQETASHPLQPLEAKHTDSFLRYGSCLAELPITSVAIAVQRKSLTAGCHFKITLAWGSCAI